MALATVTNNCHFTALDDTQVRVIIVENFDAHNNTSFLINSKGHTIWRLVARGAGCPRINTASFCDDPYGSSPRVSLTYALAPAALQSSQIAHPLIFRSLSTISIGSLCFHCGSTSSILDVPIRITERVVQEAREVRCRDTSPASRWTIWNIFPNTAGSACFGNWHRTLRNKPK